MLFLSLSVAACRTQQEENGDKGRVFLMCVFLGFNVSMWVVFVHLEVALSCLGQEIMTNIFSRKIKNKYK